MFLTEENSSSRRWATTLRTQAASRDQLPQACVTLSRRLRHRLMLCPAAHGSGAGAVLHGPGADICIPHLSPLRGDQLLLPTCVLTQLVTHAYPHGLTDVYFTLAVQHCVTCLVAQTGPALTAPATLGPVTSPHSWVDFLSRPYLLT